MDEDWFRWFIALAQWVFAKKMPESPHWYAQTLSVGTGRSMMCDRLRRRVGLLAAKLSSGFRAHPLGHGRVEPGYGPTEIERWAHVHRAYSR